MLHNRKGLSDANNIANGFATFFHSLFKALSLKNYNESESLFGNINLNSIRVDMSEDINKLKPRKSTGIDKIPHKANCIHPQSICAVYHFS